LCDLKIKPTDCDSHANTQATQQPPTRPPTHTHTHTYTLTGENQTNGEQQQYAAGKTKSTLVYWKSFARLTTTAKVIKCKKQKKNK